MQIVLEKPEFEQFVRRQVDAGKYASTAAVVEAALSRLMADDFAPGELERLVAEGEESLRRDGPIPAEVVFRELREMRAAARARAGK
jgi:putative addiction module CopG family antidote